MTHFPDDLAIHVSMIHRYGSIFIGRALSDLDIGSGQHAYLLAIHDRPGASQEELSRIFGVDKANTARAVKRLEEKAYLRRESDPADARAYRLFLTPAGEATIDRIRGALREWNGILIKSIPEREREAAHSIVAALARAAEEGIGMGE